ncbi:hypothetical protein Vadar_008001 [Vaccinium darrowii]|uniref:Uncharacterized protein n=1 Tax=Vaccinium darrowii TaxID=229202 RepID=A0ACB7WYU5_9ERIC|nr:hypothetical protein Vadar_008001 [Vaccinium darrowii]
MNQVKEIHPHSGSNAIGHPLCKTLCNGYPSPQEFFVSECVVNEEPHLRSYLEILLQLSTVALPSQAANMVFRVFLQWSNGLKSGILSHEDLSFLKDDDEQDMFRVKVSVLLQNLGIPALSEVITREAADHSLKADLLNWALPYAQRFIYNAHHDRYSQLEQTGFENLSHLQIVVVEKLFYRNVLTRSGIASKKRFECSCLLLGNVFYATRDSDSHALFMEFSRLLVEGTPALYLANFLHMITTMVESGSNEEQIEFLILNCQKVPKLPDDESVWSLPSVVPSSTKSKEAHTVLTVIPEQQNPTKSKRKGNWPPADWRTASGFNFPRFSRYRAEEAIPPPNKGVAYNPVPSEASDNKSVASLLGSANDSIDLVTPSDDLNLMVHKNTERDQFSFGTPNAEAAMLTGRLGELVAFNYFTTNFGAECVTWVNKDNETGLPYDIVIEEEGKSSEYIEVEATRSLKEDWFFISSRESQFAFENGESFSIVHVGLSDSNNNRARITVFKNPVRLCHQGKLQLDVMPKQLQEFSTIS